MARVCARAHVCVFEREHHLTCDDDQIQILCFNQKIIKVRSGGSFFIKKTRKEMRRLHGFTNNFLVLFTIQHVIVIASYTLVKRISLEILIYDKEMMAHYYTYIYIEI